MLCFCSFSPTKAAEAEACLAFNTPQEVQHQGLFFQDLVPAFLSPLLCLSSIFPLALAWAQAWVIGSFSHYIVIFCPILVTYCPFFVSLSSVCLQGLWTPLIGMDSSCTPASESLFALTHPAAATCPLSGEASLGAAGCPFEAGMSGWIVWLP